ncbi:MAG: undecaprenyl/decaprenyl-phosphate alpha-N-acetylglucosaminyl 1-phosphate transferase [Oscillospiraceae bacterium]|jgi:UDP-GlcNAc:undecaprenyl-phosphate GlcNAc-1-phosphate transferase|nr:undecaprenyl/decaprenyl-phosphate alpha-N-acetylglucosaminyl 1-phosphate transferase [Oscillospiraceae bacterium]
MSIYLRIGIAVASALAISFASTPAVKWLAHRVGAVDVPKDARRVHLRPMPRLGGLAIFIGFLISVVLFADITQQIRGILLGLVVIVIVGVIDDIMPLPALLKFAVQIVAALIAVFHGVVIEVFSNPFVFSSIEFVELKFLSIPITVIWIVAITNSVNLIDGLDGLAVGVSTISSIVMLVISLMVSDLNVAVVLAALAGACLGFIPYNFNPAKIFMGDTGALLLGYTLSTISILGLFKLYAVVSFAVPFLVLAVPLFDISFAFLRRLLKGQNPMSADRGHVHHRLIDMGLSQKQSVVILYIISGLLGLAAVVITTIDEIRAIILIAAVIVSLIIVFFAFRGKKKQ